jgi:Sap, sulfolipid-1-addressing protein
MWATVLLLALMAATEPVRLGMAIFLISGPRPMLNLLAFWLGGMVTGIGAAVVVLVVLRDLTSTAMQDMVSIAGSMIASSTGRHVQIALGVLALLVAALIAAGFSLHQRAPESMRSSEQSVVALPSRPTAFSWLTGRTKDALGAGFPWVALMAGLGSAGPPPIEYMVALTAILASGAAIGTQVSAAVAYMVVMLTIVELPLVSYLAKPAKTEAAMLQVRGWLRSRSRQILAVSVAVIGVVLVANA